MRGAALQHTLLRFWAGATGGIALGVVVFQLDIFVPRQPQFQVVTVGALLAGVLAMIRIGSPRAAAVLGLMFALYQGATGLLTGWQTAFSLLLWSLTVCAGLVLISLIYELLLQHGFRVGKFLVLGPLLGGVYFAAAPASLLWNVPPGVALRTLLLNVFLGIVIGDGVGLGVEIVDLALGERNTARPA